jgi:predicted O-linked N-acetylglucosamine transferase (SPINDLY family)
LDDAVAALRRGDASGAARELTSMLAAAGVEDERARILAQRGRALQAMGDLAAAAADLERALAIAPGDAPSWIVLGIVRSDLRDLPAAIAAFAQAVKHDPGQARAWNNLGNAQWQHGDVEDAVASFQRAVAIQPDYALAHGNLGSALRSLGRRRDAERALVQALRLDPKLVSAMQALGALHKENGRIDEAVALYARAAQLAPRDAVPCMHLARLLGERDDLAGAQRVYVEAARRDPAMLSAWIGQRLLLPQIYRDADHVDLARRSFDEGLAALAAGLPEPAASLAQDRRIDNLRWTNFLLAYQGRDDRALQERYGRLLAGLLEPGAAPAPRARVRAAGERIRIGFVSAFFRESTVGNYFVSWITDLPTDLFDVHVYNLHGSRDPLSARLRQAARVFRECPRMMPSRVARTIRDDALDAIVYPELGMDATTFVLGALRLAPLQCTAWGHPVTTGHPAIDVYFSSEAMEPPDAQRFYSERLMTLPGIGTRYSMPEVPAQRTRAQFGLPEDRPLYLCPQSLFKVLPDDDALFARVLAAVPEAALVMCNGRNDDVTRLYRARLEATLARQGVDAAGRVHWLPTLAHDDYLRANAVCDAMLDTTHWSGGNTSIDAIAAGLPIVTLEGDFMRSRQSAAMLRIAGADGLIAGSRDDYVAKAAAIVRDRDWRAQQVAALVAGRARIFDDARPVRALADALRSLCDARGG